MTLARVQEVLFRAFSGEGLAEEAAALVHGGALSPLDRIGLYAEMSWLRFRDALRADYPFVRRVVGDDGFDALVARHLRTRPSTHHSLGRLGTDFSKTIGEAGEAAWLGDLAALEWARAESFVALDAPVLTPAALASLTPDTFVHSRLVASPSLRLLELGHDVLPTWRALEAGQAFAPPAAVPTHVVCWRNGFHVYHVAVDAAEARALECVQMGLQVPAVCECFADAPEPIRAAFTAISSWAAEGMLSALVLDEA